MQSGNQLEWRMRRTEARLGEMVLSLQVKVDVRYKTDTGTRDRNLSPGLDGREY